MADKKNLLYLFDRPIEPVFARKGDNNSVYFDVPNNLLSDRYKPLNLEIANRFGEGSTQKISVKSITLPDISFTDEIGRREGFSLFNPRHRRISGRLIELFLGMRTVDDLQSICVYSRDRINPFLYNYALSVALLHRPDTKDLDLPTLAETFPEKFVAGGIFTNVREEATIVPEGSRQPIEIPRDFTATDLEVEHRLAYFREDIGVNLHHWHWHLVYPNAGPIEIVRKDRRGELFFYMHQQIQARYNFERFCNKMARVKRFIDWKKPIEEGYFPKLDSFVASRPWAGRIANSTVQDVNRELDGIIVDIDDMTRWRDRIYDAIHSGVIRDASGQNITLTENEGIDILGNIVEACTGLTPNMDYYGDIHNMGHMIIGYIHDPDQRHLEQFGVIGDSSTAMRDPAFYRWHAYCDDLFQEFKGSLPRYTINQLNYNGITIPKVEVTVQGSAANQLQTFWQQSDVDLSRGMDFVPRGSVFARFTHLQHQPFTYNITVNNATNGPRMGTVRIFLAPKFDERGTTMSFREHKLLFIELDKFTVTLTQGNNTVTRRSDQSSVTIPFERTFRNVDRDRPTGGDALDQFNFCGCGWPQHMLIPKGSPEGMACVLFVMVSNYEDDRIEQTLDGVCGDAASFCGIKDKLYPDKRSMGYPFDRMPRQGVETLAQFLTPNMRTQDVTIKFTDRTVVNKQRGGQ